MNNQNSIELTDAEISAVSGGTVTLSPEQQAAIKSGVQKLTFAEKLRLMEHH